MIGSVIYPSSVCSNRSVAFLNLARLTKTLADAEMTIKLKPTWEKVLLPSRRKTFYFVDLFCQQFLFSDAFGMSHY